MRKAGKSLALRAAEGRCRAAVAALLALAPCAAWSATGLSPTGFGAESEAWGGVDLAVAHDTTALNTNPAGLAQLSRQSFDLYLTPFYALVKHEDDYNERRNINNKFGGVLGTGYSHPLNDGLVAGVGLFVQGGDGFAYDNLVTRYGTRDDASAIVGVFKLAPGIAWRVDDDLSIGASLGISYGTARQKLFYNTSVADQNNPADSFFGTRYDSGKAWGFNGKVGLLYKPTDRLTLALAYTSKTPLDFKNGSLSVNYESIGMGRVKYRDASQTGLAFAQEVGAGLLYRVNWRWRVGAQVKWLDQHQALHSSTLKATDPDGPAPADEILATQPLNWHNETVIGIGSDYQIDEFTTIRGGFSHAHDPIPANTLNPLLALISENDVAMGISRQVSLDWTMSATVECQVPTNEPGNNALLPFGPSREGNSALFFTLMVSRRW